MCRWMAWHGQPVLIEELLFRTQHGIVDQSLHSRMGAETTNGDGFGMGWYGDGDGPGVYHSVSQKWLQGYVNEYVWRYNRREDGNAMFRDLIETAAVRVI